MTDALSEIEAAILEVTKTRQSVTRHRSKQVSSADEIVRLKSVAFAWFKTHRAQVLLHSARPDLAPVDAPYRLILDATGGHAARKTYADALRAAKMALVELRGVVAQTPNGSPQHSPAPTSASSAEIPPNFAPLAADPKMQAILSRRWAEVQQCVACRANLAATVMMGGLLESLLLARINASPNKSSVFTAHGAPRDKTGKTLPLADWNLVKMVDVAHELAWITKSAKDVGNVLRDFRNYIHPHKEYSENICISEQDADMFWQVTKSISRQVLGSVGKPP
jgi:hypothetical protein